jgi:hypothetical protein
LGLEAASALDFPPAGMPEEGNPARRARASADAHGTKHTRCVRGAVGSQIEQQCMMWAMLKRDNDTQAWRGEGEEAGRVGCGCVVPGARNASSKYYLPLAPSDLAVRFSGFWGVRGPPRGGLQAR